MYPQDAQSPSGQVSFFNFSAFHLKESDLCTDSVQIGISLSIQPHFVMSHCRTAPVTKMAIKTPENQATFPHK